jgi:bifunctional non-homologous end joining protein LigD
LKEAIDRLKPFFIDKSPVENPPKIPEKIQWVQPKVVCEVSFAGGLKMSSCAKQRS